MNFMTFKMANVLSFSWIPTSFPHNLTIFLIITFWNSLNEVNNLLGLIEILSPKQYVFHWSSLFVPAFHSTTVLVESCSIAFWFQIIKAPFAFIKEFAAIDFHSFDSTRFFMHTWMIRLFIIIIRLFYFCDKLFNEVLNWSLDGSSCIKFYLSVNSFYEFLISLCFIINCSETKFKMLKFSTTDSSIIIKHKMLSLMMLLSFQESHSTICILILIIDKTKVVFITYNQLNLIRIGLKLIILLLASEFDLLVGGESFLEIRKLF